MRRRSVDPMAALKPMLLACPLLLAGIVASAAGGFDYAKPMINPRYLAPEIPSFLAPACQVVVKTPVPPQYGVTSDDLLYCELPRYSSRFPSDVCACAFHIGGVKVLRPGRVVWRPSSWGYVVPW